MRNVVNVDTLSTALLAFDADHSAHGIAINVAISCAITSSVDRTGEPLLDQVGHRRLAVAAELHAEIAASTKSPSHLT